MPITLNDEAAIKVAEFADKAGDGFLRLGIKGGGCSGFQYVLAFDHQSDDDLIFESQGHTILVSLESYPYVAGSEIVWKDEIISSGFDVINPNATAACGCGSSFRVDKDAEGCSAL